MIRQSAEHIQVRAEEIAGVAFAGRASLDTITSAPVGVIEQRPRAIAFPRVMEQAVFKITPEITGYEVMESPGVFSSKFISYKIVTQVKNLRSEVEKSIATVVVYRRYNDFVSFDARLRQVFSSRIFLPSLPPKEAPHLNYDIPVIERRLRYLKAWLHFVCSHPDIQKVAILGDFVAGEHVPPDWIKELSASASPTRLSDMKSFLVNDDYELTGQGHLSNIGALVRYSEREKHTARSSMSLITR